MPPVVLVLLFFVNFVLFWNVEVAAAAVFFLVFCFFFTHEPVGTYGGRVSLAACDWLAAQHCQRFCVVGGVSFFFAFFVCFGLSFSKVRSVDFFCFMLGAWSRVVFTPTCNVFSGNFLSLFASFCTPTVA